MRKLSMLLVFLLILAVCGLGCGEEPDDDGESCPSFKDQQLLPDSGGPSSDFVLWVELKEKKANRQLSSVVANAFFADGRSAGKTFDLVRVEEEPYKYLRTFTGEEVCEANTCTLFFQVIAVHEDGCRKSFDTPLFQVIWPDESDDDTSD
ncbi:MAG: hypothetical protein P9L99_12305 [Candidatus Lernaella stagnicola]|nr:hypothetical protein [Candidatus Lernaella stagnicola]